jgi:hypothetical protein
VPKSRDFPASRILPLRIILPAIPKAAFARGISPRIPAANRLNPQYLLVRQISRAARSIARARRTRTRCRRRTTRAAFRSLRPRPIHIHLRFRTHEFAPRKLLAASAENQKLNTDDTEKSAESHREIQKRSQTTQVARQQGAPRSTTKLSFFLQPFSVLNLFWPSEENHAAGAPPPAPAAPMCSMLAPHRFVSSALRI